MKILEYPFGKAFCYDKYVYFEREPYQDLSVEQVQTLMRGIDVYYHNRKFVYISNRKMRTIIDINAYQHLNKKQMVAIAIVTDQPNAEETLLEEQAMFDGPFAFFKTLDQAISWATTFELD
ncbi:hypothetical protein [Flavimarina sp. Hel_I_48]|uniref:hypothetical protein n=1 Tax=Flavimarina sp. Hel_I_48 TaxID=1392488 RepID=UPI0004DF6862|nr:hypothetical protein [Flavimarina sp. Hel_I_48]